MRIGINPISWTNDDLPALGGETPLETALAEGKAIGYEGFELGNKFPHEPDALRAVLARHGLACVSGWYSGRLACGSVADEIAAVDGHLDLLARNGAQVMVYGEVITPEDLPEHFIDNLTDFWVNKDRRTSGWLMMRTRGAVLSVIRVRSGPCTRVLANSSALR